MAGFIETKLRDSIPADDTRSRSMCKAHTKMPEPNPPGPIRATCVQGRLIRGHQHRVDDFALPTQRPRANSPSHRGLDGTGKRPWGVVIDDFPIVIAPALGHKPSTPAPGATSWPHGERQPIARTCCFQRLRLPGTLYDRKDLQETSRRSAIPTLTRRIRSTTADAKAYPREYGRRMEFSRPSATVPRLMPMP